jgi:Skp family chaperone for outer membrane proteins
MGLGAAALGVYVGGSVWAQNQPTSAALRTRVAFLNLNEVLKNYGKYKALRETLKAKDAEYMDQYKTKQTRMDKLMVEHKDPKTVPAQKDKIEQEVKQLRFDQDNIKATASKEIVKLHDDSVAQYYWEIYQVVQEYAATNGIDIVLRYNEEWNDDYNTPARVVDRMKMPFWPMYYDRKVLDITNAVAGVLQKKHPAPQAAAPATGGVVPASGTRP